MLTKGGEMKVCSDGIICHRRIVIEKSFVW